jgi:hypothetical protein
MSLWSCRPGWSGRISLTRVLEFRAPRNRTDRENDCRPTARLRKAHAYRSRIEGSEINFANRGCSVVGRSKAATNSSQRSCGKTNSFCSAKIISAFSCALERIKSLMFCPLAFAPRVMKAFCSNEVRTSIRASFCPTAGAINTVSFRTLYTQIDAWARAKNAQTVKLYLSMACAHSRTSSHRFNSLRISLAAFAPEPPVNPAPGCVPLPHKYRFSIGVRYRAQSSSGRMVKN